MATGPGDELASSEAERGHLRVSHAEREQVIGLLKAAFVRGMLVKDEFDLRVSQALASRTYAELAAVTADLRVEVATVQAGKPVLRPGQVFAGATALWGGIQAFVFLSPWPEGNQYDPALLKVVLFFAGTFTYVIIALICVAFAIAGWRARRASQRPPRRQTPGQSSRRQPSAGPGGELPPTGRGDHHVTEARRGRPARAPRINVGPVPG